MLLNIVVSIILLRIPTFYMLAMIFQNIEEVMDAKLKRLVNWRAATKLSLNESKTQLFFSVLKDNTTTLSLTLNVITLL